MAKQKEIQKYSITNTTRKSNPKNARERNGYLVGVIYTRNGNNVEQTLQPGQEVISDSVTEAMLKMLNSGIVAIKPVKSISALLAKHTALREKNAVSMEEQTKAKTTAPKSNAKASEMGTVDKPLVDALKSGVDAAAGAINPDAGSPISVTAKSLNGFNAENPETESTVKAPSSKNRREDNQEE